ncbi:MAG: iron-containing alcohol dehydrogenase [Bacteroidota bacterium]
MNINFILKTQLEAGAGSLQRIPAFLTTHNYKRVGFITDQGIHNNKALAELRTLLTETGAGITVDYIYNLPFEPDYDSLDRVKAEFKSGESSRVDVIIAAGGGSVLDFAKGIATLITNHSPALNYRGFPKDLNPSIPVIAIPSTAGTASEVTYNAVFINKADKRKLGINTFNNFPVLAVLDPALTKGAPYRVALGAALDALVHTLESFAANKHNELTRIFAVAAFRNLINNIENALQKEEEKSLSAVQLGAYLAGISLMNAGSGPAGAISYPLGVVFSIPHGIAGGIILPYLVQHNINKGYKDYDVLFEQIENAELKNKASNLAEYFFQLYERLNVWEEVKKIDVNNTDFKEYVSILQGAFDQNPVSFTVEDAFTLLNNLNNKNLK